MPEAERRTVQELVTRYEFEPNLKDIYVEGPEDKAILDAMLEEHQIEGVSVFEIANVHVPSEYGEENSSRTRLVKLATLLVEALGAERPRVACVVDSDFDSLSACREENAFLVRTDYANMEMYFFSPPSLERISRRCLRGKRISDYMIAKFMVPTLQSLFLIRYVNSREEWHLHCMSFDRLVSFRRGRFGFDRDEYLRRYLNKNGRVRDFAAFVEALEAVAVPSGRDARCFIHGHDFLRLLRRMLNCLRGQNVYGNEEVVFSILRAGADYAALAEEAMFAEILRRFRGQASRPMDHEQGGSGDLLRGHPQGQT